MVKGFIKYFGSSFDHGVNCLNNFTYRFPNLAPLLPNPVRLRIVVGYVFDLLLCTPSEHQQLRPVDVELEAS